jgi:hypothetical protein
VITPSPPSHEDIDIDWDGDGVTLTQHPLLGLSPWDYEIYRSPAGYQPQDPEDHGGALYGEKLWVTAGAMNIDLGPDDGCCGKNDYGGCGHCVLIQNPNSLNHDWSVLAMKKNTGGIGYITWPHLDINVPGYDALEWSWANICGDKPNTGLTKAERCDNLPEAYQKGCKVISEWGWTGKMENAKYKVIECPERFN